jgi:hypothetical protein
MVNGHAHSSPCPPSAVPAVTTNACTTAESSAKLVNASVVNGSTGSQTHRAADDYDTFTVLLQMQPHDKQVNAVLKLRAVEVLPLHAYRVEQTAHTKLTLASCSAITLLLEAVTFRLIASRTRLAHFSI